MKELTNVDIISINCVNPQASVAALNHCQKYFKFGKSILVSHIEPSEYYEIELHQLEEKLSWDGYNDHILNLKDHTDNDFVMVIQDDGYIVNPELWDDGFLEYDYIGAPWPIEDNWISMQHKEHQSKLRENLPKNRVGNGGFCIRSRKFLEFSSQFKDTGILGEDTFLCTKMYQEAIDYGIKFAPFELAIKFAYENPCFEYDGHHWDEMIEFDQSKHFGWHGNQFSNKNELLSLKYK